MDQDNRDRRPQDSKSSPGNNYIWILLLLGIPVLVYLVLTPWFESHEVSYSDLVRLVKTTKTENGKTTGKITVTVDDETVVYSNLRDVKVGDYEITGTVDIEYPESQDPERGPKEGVEFKTHKSATDESEVGITKLLTEKDISWRFKEPPSMFERFLPMLLLTVLLILFFIIVMRRFGGAGSAMAFGRSRGKLYAQEELGVTFGDVAGIDEAVEELREVVDFLRTPEKYQKLGGRIPKGVLLVGPPGTGKTLLAKAIAGEADVPFFSLSGSDFVEMFVGVGAARVRDMFQQAVSRAPCIIFIDELDALGKTRGSGIVGGHDEREQTLNALLVEMDGFESNNGVIVLSATNRPETLDPALLRPGRFDRHVLVDRPDIRGREEILKVHVQNVKLAPEVDLKKIASISSGFVGADLANLVNEAALLAARKEKSAVSMDEFNEGVERVTAGLEKRQRVIHEDEKQRVAYHESGHALVAFSLPNTDPVHKVSIIPRGLAALGYTMQRPEGDRYLLTQGELESRIQVLLAGQVAEEMIYGEISTGAQNDLERATGIARSMVMDFGMSRLGQVNFRQASRNLMLDGPTDERIRAHSEHTMREIDEEISRIIAHAREKAGHILEVRREALVALAERLMVIESIGADELRAIIESKCPGPAISPGTTDTPKRSPSEEADTATENESGADPAEGTA
jgi:cell division protease FtsH